MPFASGPTLRYLTNGLYETTTITEYVGATEVVHIPAGFKTDLASVPRLAWPMLAPWGTHESAAVVHDALCDELNRYHRLLLAWRQSPSEGPPPPVPQINSRDTDGLFRRVCRESGVPAPLYWELWWGVRLGALFNPARRPGSLRTLPAVLLLTAVNLAAAYGAWWGSSALFGLLFW